MSLLGKLFGDEKKASEALDFLKNLADGKGNGNSSPGAEAPKPEPVQQVQQPQNAAQAYYEDEEEEYDTVHGWWGGKMPAEENQYTYQGPYYEYFEKIYREEFPQYRVEKEAAAKYDGTVFTFYEGDRKVLVTEVISENSEPEKLRRICRKTGVPYLRYYYDYHGWWNARSYVITRTKEALGI